MGTGTRRRWVTGGGDSMAIRSTPPTPRVKGQTVLACVVGGLVLLLIVAGLASSGVSGGLLMLGLAAIIIGAIAAVRRGAAWAFLPDRKAGAIVAGVGLL